MKRSDEKYDICKFCENLWGEDRQGDCTTPCVCANYINQDYVYQREFTIGLPGPRSIRMPAYTESVTYWSSLSLEEKKGVASRVGDLALEADPVLFQMITLLLSGNTKEEICEELGIESTTYDKYAERLRDTKK